VRFSRPVLLRKPTLDAIAAGEVSVAFRCWKRPTVRAGGRLRTAIGELAIREVDPIAPEDVTDADARRAGFAGREEMLAAHPCPPDRRLHRIAFELAGPDPRVALRDDDALTGTQVRDIAQRLERMDAHSPDGPWTDATLRLIAENPATRAADLAPRLGKERLPFKARVRRLKELGLTESLEVGYRLSPRGEAYRRLSRSARGAPRR
jgi:hypothetical protein